jgi:hypothetical protein
LIAIAIIVNHYMKKHIVLFTTVALIASALIFSCNDSPQFPSENVEKGYYLAQKYCKSCHLFPEPILLDKKTWTQHVLPKMGSLLGFRYMGENAYFEDGHQLMSKEDWNKILLYYYVSSPSEPVKRKEDISIQKGLKLFTATIPSFGVRSPATTMVCIDTGVSIIYFGEGAGGQLYKWSNGKMQDSIPVGTGISNLRKSTNTYWVLTMGVLYPSDEKVGKLVTIESGSKKQTTILDSLRRPVYASYADLNNDSLQDIIVCEFGDKTGALSWFENNGDSIYNQHILKALPGAIETAVHDFNNDGKLDIVTLMAQGDEGLFMYYNLGNGKFREERLIQLPPSYGSNSFQLADFNSDGFLDIIATNGDNGDYPPVLKAYHGIRIYLNNGKNKFKEALFLPVNGVGKAIAKDFDQDGDLDLASIAYFPDYKDKPEEAFIYWENKGNLLFQASSFKQVSDGRWITMDAGDIDSDGDIDIVLGNANFTVGNIPARLKNKWDTTSSAILVLENLYLK